jgi:hypothetical protein
MKPPRGVCRPQAPLKIELRYGISASPPEARQAPATLRAAIDLGSPFEGLQFGGILGREFFRQLIVTIDYAHKTLTLTNPQVFRAEPQRDGAARDSA